MFTLMPPTEGVRKEEEEEEEDGAAFEQDFVAAGKMDRARAY
eukprot:COSAG03_NODE_14519_length_461_cov_1.486188_1_plen_41_part_10